MNLDIDLGKVISGCENANSNQAKLASSITSFSSGIKDVSAYWNDGTTGPFISSIDNINQSYNSYIDGSISFIDSISAKANELQGIVGGSHLIYSKAGCKEAASTARALASSLSNSIFTFSAPSGYSIAGLISELQSFGRILTSFAENISNKSNSIESTMKAFKTLSTLSNVDRGNLMIFGGNPRLKYGIDEGLATLPIVAVEAINGAANFGADQISALYLMGDDYPYISITGRTSKYKQTEAEQFEIATNIREAPDKFFDNLYKNDSILNYLNKKSVIKHNSEGADIVKKIGYTAAMIGETILLSKTPLGLTLSSGITGYTSSRGATATDTYNGLVALSDNLTLEEKNELADKANNVGRLKGINAAAINMAGAKILTSEFTTISNSTQAYQSYIKANTMAGITSGYWLGNVGIDYYAYKDVIKDNQVKNFAINNNGGIDAPFELSAITVIAHGGSELIAFRNLAKQSESIISTQNQSMKIENKANNLILNRVTNEDPFENNIIDLIKVKEEEIDFSKLKVLETLLEVSTEYTKSEVSSE